MCVELCVGPRKLIHGVDLLKVSFKYLINWQVCGKDVENKSKPPRLIDGIFDAGFQGWSLGDWK